MRGQLRTVLMGDLLTLVQPRLPAKIVVFNNGALGFIELRNPYPQPSSTPGEQT